MESWIGILIVVLMIPGLLLLIAVVVGAVIYLRNSQGKIDRSIDTPKPSHPVDVD